MTVDDPLLRFYRLDGTDARGRTLTEIWAWDAARLHYSEISLIGSFHYSPEDAREALRMLASGEVDPRPLLTDRGNLGDLPRFLAAQRRGEVIRYAVLS